jgi:WD40 repeat protein
LETLVPHLFVASLTLVTVTFTAVAQEADYSEVRVAPSRVPPAFVKAAEKEAPGVQFLVIYRDNDKGYRLVGKAADGRTYSVRVDSKGAVEFRHIFTDVATGKLPPPVATAVRDEVARNKILAGFRPARTSRVERFNARKNAVVTFYEVFGHTPNNVHPRIEVDTRGKLLRVDTSFIPSTGDYTKREPLKNQDVPPEVLQEITEAVPGILIARMFRVTNRGTADVGYEAYGRAGRGRGAEVVIGPNGRPLTVAVSIPLREVPRAALDAIARASRTTKDLVSFRPIEARRLRLVALDEDRYQFFGDGPDGQPLDVRVDARGEVTAVSDTGEVFREEAGIAPPRAREKVAVATSGFSVLAARYGVDHHWIDVTDDLRRAAGEGLKEFKPDGLPDPAVGRHKTLVVLFSTDGKLGLAEVCDDVALLFDGPRDTSTLAPVPARGFAVLAARFGFERKWQDVTDAVRSKVASERLDLVPAQAGLPDPAPGEPKAIAVAYASQGKVGLYVQSQWRSPNLPPDAPPVNSGALLARSIEFPQKPSLVSFTSDGRSLVVGVEDGSIRVLDAANGREVHRFDGDKPGWHPVAVSAAGALIASGGADGVVRLWEVRAEREKAVLRGHTDKIQRLAFSPTRRHLASTSWDKTVRLWDVATGSEIRRLEGHTDFVDGVKFTPDGRQVVTAGWDRTVRIWDVATGHEARKIETTGDALSDVDLSKTGRNIFFGAKDGLLRWWQPDSNHEPAIINTYTDCEWACAPLPDGHRVLVSDKVAAALWDCRTAHSVLRLEKHTGRVTGLAVAPDGRRAATCSEDKTLKVWNLPDLGH